MDKPQKVQITVNTSPQKMIRIGIDKRFSKVYTKVYSLSSFFFLETQISNSMFVP